MHFGYAIRRNKVTLLVLLVILVVVNVTDSKIVLIPGALIGGFLMLSFLGDLLKGPDESEPGGR